MDILAVLRDDYQRFPHDQTYSIYTDDVYFKDPMTSFRGVERYKEMIGFIRRWFRQCTMEVHSLQWQSSGQDGEPHDGSPKHIRSDWTLSWNTPLPWQPRIQISGWSELGLNAEGLICSHVDYWHCSRLDVVRQHLPQLG